MSDETVVPAGAIESKTGQDGASILTAANSHETDLRAPTGMPIGPKAALAVAAGAVALGAVAIGALAIGSLAIGRLAIGRARIRTLEIDHLIIRRISEHD